MQQPQLSSKTFLLPALGSNQVPASLSQPAAPFLLESLASAIEFLPGRCTLANRLGVKASGLGTAMLDGCHRVYTPSQYIIFWSFPSQILQFPSAPELSSPFSNSPKFVVCSHTVSWGFTG